ncbi:hypothetical protein [Caldimonas brevitalea]|uniref:hypothetical protein n=1 Tax=Caldimonas brevitalea TaxID=413882 RepID=UPI0012F84894|nr:hypothetical protein [Caldimonas brevitalea]
MGKTATVMLFVGQSVTTPAFGCGVCVEDKMAATYDHDVVQRAAAQKRLVVFCNVKGVVKPEQMLQAAKSIPGVDADTVRASAQPMALSFALDPGVQTPERAVARVAALLGPTTEVSLIRTLSPR